jgi:hypothetical protein
MEADAMVSNFKRWGLGAAIALALTSLSLAALAQQPNVPVLAGGEADYDACGSQGVVRGLDPGGDGFLAVRGGPSSKHGMIVNLCDQRGSWLGVVYSHETMDCGVGTPWPRRQVYSGPCRSGWVYKKFVTDFAG